jgi:hypothetical protein
MSKLGRQLKRAGIAKKKRDARENYRKNRELGACFLNEKGCQNNGDLITHCKFCDYKVQACTEHSVLGRNKVKRHLHLKHPVKSMSAVTMGVLRGQSLE